MRNDYKLTVHELNIVQELLKKCTNKNISDSLMYRLNEKWGYPNFNIDYKKYEKISTPFEQVKKFYLENNLKFNLALHSRAYYFISQFDEIYSIRIWSNSIHISAKSRSGHETIAINKKGEVIFVGINDG